MTCPTGKRPFRSRHAAEREAKRLARRNHSKRPNRTYKCPDCGDWHNCHRNPAA